MRTARAPSVGARGARARAPSPRPGARRMRCSRSPSGDSGVRGCGRAITGADVASLQGWVYGGRRGQHAARQDAAERALPLLQSSRTGRSRRALARSPTRSTGADAGSRAIARCEELLADERFEPLRPCERIRVPRRPCRPAGGLRAARDLVASAEDDLRRARVDWRTPLFSGVLGDVELLAGRRGRGRSGAPRLCEDFEHTCAIDRLASQSR